MRPNHLKRLWAAAKRRWEKEIDAGQGTLFDTESYRDEPRGPPLKNTQVIKPKKQEPAPTLSLFDDFAPSPEPQRTHKGKLQDGTDVDLNAPYANVARERIAYFLNHGTKNKCERSYGKAVADRIEGKEVPLPTFSHAQWGGEISLDVEILERRITHIIEDIWVIAKGQY